MKSEKTIKPTPGWVGVTVVLLCLGLAIGGLVMGIVLAFVVFIILTIFFTIGFVVNAPNESCATPTHPKMRYTLLPVMTLV